MNGTTTTTAAAADSAHSLDVRSGAERIDSASAKLLYVYLAAVGEATATELCEQLSVSHLTALSLLETLASRGLVAKRENAYVVASN